MSYLFGKADYSDLPTVEENGKRFSGVETKFFTGSLSGVPDALEAAGTGFAVSAQLALRTTAEAYINADPRVVQGDETLRTKALDSLDAEIFPQVDETLTHLDALNNRDRGFMGEMTYGLTRVLAEYAVGGIAGVGINQALPRTAEEIKQGTDMGTAAALGALQGGVNAVGVALPGTLPLVKGFSPLAQRVGYGVVSNVPLGMVQRGGEQALLESAGQTERAAELPEWNDVKSVALDTLVGAVFGGVARAHEVLTAPKAKTAPTAEEQASKAQQELGSQLSESSKAVILTENLDDYTTRNQPIVGNTPEAEIAVRAAMTEVDMAMRERRAPDLSMLDGQDVTFMPRDLTTPKTFDAIISGIRNQLPSDGVGLKAFRDAVPPEVVQQFDRHSIIAAPDAAYIPDRAMVQIRKVGGVVDPVVRDPQTGRVFVLTDQIKAGNEKAVAERAILMAQESPPIATRTEPLREVNDELAFAEISAKELRNLKNKDVDAVLKEADEFEAQAKDAQQQIDSLIGCMLGYV